MMRTDPWLKQEFWHREVRLRRIGSGLVDHGFWQVADAWHFQNTTVEVFGPRQASKRLAVILWSVREGILRDPGSAGGATNDTVQSGTQHVDGVVVVRPAAHIHCDSDPELLRYRMGAFSTQATPTLVCRYPWAKSLCP